MVNSPYYVIYVVDLDRDLSQCVQCFSLKTDIENVNLYIGRCLAQQSYSSSAGYMSGKYIMIQTTDLVRDPEYFGP